MESNPCIFSSASFTQHHETPFAACSNSLLCEYNTIYLSVLLWMDIWEVSCVLLFRIVLLWTTWWFYFPFLLGVFRTVEFLGLEIYLTLTLMDHTEQFSNVALLICTPASNAWVFSQIFCRQWHDQVWAFQRPHGCYEENGLERQEFLGRPVGGCYGGSRGRWEEDEISWDREKYTDSGESSGGEVDGSRGCTVVPYCTFMV